MRPLVLTKWLLLLGVMATLSCSRCGKTPSGGGDLLRLLPRNSDTVVVIPDVAALGQKLRILESLKAATFAAQLQGYSNANDLTTSLLEQVGVDVRSAEAMEKAGLDPKRGFGFALLDNRHAYFVVGLTDEKAFKEKVTALARSRLGAREVSQDGAVTAFSRGPGAAPVLGLLIEKGTAFVATDQAVKALPSYAAITEEKSLSSDENLKKGLARLPSERDGFVYLPKRGLFPERAVEGTVITFHLSKTGLSVRSDLRWNYTGDALKALVKAPGPSLFALTPNDAFAVIRYGVDPAKLAPLVPYLIPERMLQELKSAGLDVRSEILEQLKPGALITSSLAPNVNLGAGLPTLDLRRTNPFRFVNLTAVGEVPSGRSENRRSHHPGGSQWSNRLPDLLPRRRRRSLRGDEPTRLRGGTHGKAG
jgi:hypothetical protein